MRRIRHENKLLKDWIDAKRSLRDLTEMYYDLYTDYIQMYEGISQIQYRLHKGDQFDVGRELLRLLTSVSDARMDDKFSLCIEDEIKEDISRGDNMGEVPWE